MTGEEKNILIQKYAAGFNEVSESLKNFPTGKLTAKPFAGKWSAAEIVHHLADSEMNSALRLRKLLAEEKPIIYGYDQDFFAIKMLYNEREIEPSLMIFRYARESCSQLLEIMSDDDWKREGWHTESGLYTPETWLEIYAAHAHGHAGQIRRLREFLADKSVASA